MPSFSSLIVRKDFSPGSLGLSIPCKLNWMFVKRKEKNRKSDLEDPVTQLLEDILTREIHYNSKDLSITPWIMSVNPKQVPKTMGHKNSSNSFSHHVINIPVKNPESKWIPSIVFFL